MVTDVCMPRYDRHFVNWIADGGHVYGCQIRAVGRYMIEIHKMTYNLRVVICDRLAPVYVDMTGHAWCYPKELGFVKVSEYVWEWDFDPADPGATHPPGPWIKAVHSGVYRQPRLGQRGPT